MENEDATFVVIIGNDDDNLESGNEQIPNSFFQIKQEVEDDLELDAEATVKDILEHAFKVGQFIELDQIENNNIKTVPEFLDTEYLKDEIEHDQTERESKDYEADEDNYIPDEDLGVSELEMNESDMHTDSDSGGQRRKPMFIKSFVEDLRNEYPKLRGNDTQLVMTLVEIMKSVKRPPPPKDYVIRNNISYECVKCGFVSESDPAAWRHWQEKHGKRYLVCYACGVDFRSSTNLYKHEKKCIAKDAKVVLKARAIVLGRKGRGRPCLSQDEKFLSNNSTEYNKRSSTVSAAAVAATDACEARGGARLELQAPTPLRHVLIIIERFPCTICSAVFNTKSNLQSHENVHRGLRPYRCNQCINAYTSSSALSRHVRKHRNEKFICDHCQRSFNTRHTLITHLDTHSLVRKFGCSLCPKRYAQKTALKLHIGREHFNLPPPCACQICPKRYPRMSLLKEHMKKAHGKTLMTKKMFFKMQPTLTDTQLQQAILVLKSDSVIVKEEFLDSSTMNEKDIVEFPDEAASVDMFPDLKRRIDAFRTKS